MAEFIELDCSCANCGKMLSARPVSNPSPFSIRGLLHLEYIHTDGTDECVIIKTPGPYDAFYGTRKFEEARQKMWDDETPAEAGEDV